jgi:hypothetical protein
MKTQWTSHIKDEDEKDRFQKQIMAAKPVLERLSTLLDHRQAAIESIEVGVDKYIQPGWSAIQAHYNGEKASIRYIKNLLNLDQREKQDGRQPV